MENHVLTDILENAIFFRNIGYCKFGEWCHFSHILKKDPDLENLKKENRAIITKLEELEKLSLRKLTKLKVSLNQLKR